MDGKKMATKSNTIRAAALNADPGKAAAVERERARLMELFTGIPDNKKEFVLDAVQHAAWLGITIQELQRDIDERGPVVPFQNGKGQSGLQANPACKTLKDFQTLYNSIFRSLLPVLPEKYRRHSKLESFLSDSEEVSESFPCDDGFDNGLPLNLDNV